MRTPKILVKALTLVCAGLLCCASPLSAHAAEETGIEHEEHDDHENYESHESSDSHDQDSHESSASEGSGSQSNDTSASASDSQSESSSDDSSAPSQDTDVISEPITGQDDGSSPADDQIWETGDGTVNIGDDGKVRVDIEITDEDDFEEPTPQPDEPEDEEHEEPVVPVIPQPTPQPDEPKHEEHHHHDEPSTPAPQPAPAPTPVSEETPVETIEEEPSTPAPQPAPAPTPQPPVRANANPVTADDSQMLLYGVIMLMSFVALVGMTALRFFGNKDDEFVDTDNEQAKQWAVSVAVMGVAGTVACVAAENGSYLHQNWYLPCVIAAIELAASAMAPLVWSRIEAARNRRR